MMPSFIELWNRFQAEQRQAARMVEWRKLPTDELKRLWDAFDGDAKKGEPGYFWPAGDEPHIEDIHTLLNERGEGNYCAC